MSKRLYAAYGSNLNIQQMASRCPGAKLYGTGVIENFELQFKVSLTVRSLRSPPKDGASVPVAVWEISKRNEQALDRYEGYPSHYFKQDVPVQLDGKEVTAMVYVMNLKMDFGLPAPYYYDVVREGYEDCGLDPAALEQALRREYRAVLRLIGRTKSPSFVLKAMQNRTRTNWRKMTIRI